MFEYARKTASSGDELLGLKKTHLLTQDKRKMEMLDPEWEYWHAIRKSIKQEQQRPTTRVRK
jgi:hypothetical protein